MKTLAFAIFLGALVLAAGYAAGQYLAQGYQIERQIQYQSQPVSLFGVPGQKH